MALKDCFINISFNHEISKRKMSCLLQSQNIMAKTLCAKIILMSRDKNSSHRWKKNNIFLFLKRFYIITRSPRTHLPLPSSPSLLFFTGKRTKSLGPRSPSVSILNFINDTFYYMNKVLIYNQSINQYRLGGHFARLL